MPSIQVKDVPAEAHAIHRQRAAAAGKSLQEYLLEKLVDDAARPTVDEVLRRVGHRTDGRADFVTATEIIRIDRDAR